MSAHGTLLAVAPVHRGFGYVVLDKRGTLFDWCVKEVREKAEHKNARCLAEVDKLIDRYRPTVLVLETHHMARSRKRQRVRELLEILTEHAIESGIGVAAYGPREVRLRLGLSPTTNKVMVARAVSTRLPALKRRTPSQRHIWQHENYSMPIFVAAALALAHRGNVHGGKLVACLPEPPSHREWRAA